MGVSGSRQICDTIDTRKAYKFPQENDSKHPFFGRFGNLLPEFAERGDGQVRHR